MILRGHTVRLSARAQFLLACSLCFSSQCSVRCTGYRHLLTVLTCFPLFPIASHCLQLLPIASYCFLLLPIASYYFLLLSIASYCLPLLPIASHCFPLRSVDSHCFLLLPIASHVFERYTVSEVSTVSASNSKSNFNFINACSIKVSSLSWT